ncbi:photosynthetic NDH subunit of subcomplex B 1, chloroplastic-like [Zingiber officinale]|uniref:photosynthetic NDH subunit of subcomplex B 1, chloroplastic-like n=1 Tax=Zingiber officinale TaxID=94328 RepID=UPI001C4CBE25|nr:photosynthetic NDH subunit of subcomplex B 1, chloroplastic-like [Zingiber officinale]
MGFNVKLTSLASKVRDDVCLCCCVISGGVYENLLFFPVIQLIKDRYPGVQIDVVASPKGKQVYEVNKNVRWANVYDPDEDFPEPTEYVNMIGLLKLAGLGHAAFLFMTSTRDKVSYVYPNVNVAGAGLLLTETFTSPTMNLSECGYHMYDEMEEWLGRSFCSVPRHPVSPLRVPISKKLRAYVEEKYSKVGVRKGGFVVIHGIETDSVASMRSKGDSDSLLPIQVWVEIVKGLRVVKPLFVIPHEKVREDVEEVVGDDTHIFFITTPGQLAALVDDAIRVIATNTAALQLANARNKPSIALFSSEEKANTFVPNAREKRCSIIASSTRKLIDIDVESVKNTVEIFEGSKVLINF